VKTLIEKGHQRIGFINSTDDIPASRGRFTGYQEALREFDLSFDARLVKRGNGSRGGYQAALELMQQTNPPTAIFCFNDHAAMGVYDALRNLNLAIPDDVAVIGFDNQELIAPNLYPSLTTMELPHYEMGKWAAEKLLSIINKPQVVKETNGQHKMPCPLIIRKSA
jgi:LacI family transcriptional regulator